MQTPGLADRKTEYRILALQGAAWWSFGASIMVSTVFSMGDAGLLAGMLPSREK